MLTLEKFEEASEVVKQVAIETKLLYSAYFSNQTGNKVYLKPENMQLTDPGSLLQDKHADRGRTGKRTDHRLRRKSCPGRGLCG